MDEELLKYAKKYQSDNKNPDDVNIISTNNNEPFDDGFTFDYVSDTQIPEKGNISSSDIHTHNNSGRKKNDHTPEKKKSFRLRYFFILLLGTIAVISLGLFITYNIMLISGRNKLQANAIVYQGTPELIDSAVSDTTQVTWQSGWVKHNSGIYQYNDDILTFLVMGIDSKTTVSQAESFIKGGQSDALLLIVMDTDARTIRMVNINRNTMAEIQVYNAYGDFLNSTTAQINLQHGYGDGMELSCERTVSAVSNLFYGIPIHGYVSVNYVAIPEINDLAGGVTVTVLNDLTKFDSALVEGATVKLNGKQAFRYVQYRDTKEFDSVSVRMERIKQYLVALINTLVDQTKHDLTIPAKFYNTISPYMVTNISLDEVAYLASEALSYTIDTNVIALKGETKMGLKFEEFYADEDALYDLVIDLFYEPVNANN